MVPRVLLRPIFGRLASSVEVELVPLEGVREAHHCIFISEASSKFLFMLAHAEILACLLLQIFRSEVGDLPGVR